MRVYVVDKGLIDQFRDQSYRVYIDLDHVLAINVKTEINDEFRRITPLRELTDSEKMWRYGHRVKVILVMAFRDKPLELVFAHDSSVTDQGLSESEAQSLLDAWRTRDT